MNKIHGGWRNVPDHLKTKTQLSELRLKPVGDPIAEVWNGHQWCKLYDVTDTVKKKKLTEKQIEGISKAQETRRKNEHLKLQEEYRQQEEGQRNFGLETFGSWYKQDFLVLDTETTHLHGEIVECSIIDRNGTVLFDSLIKPKGPIHPGAYEIHGISDNMVSNAPTWLDVFPEIMKILEDRLILIYNDEFDLKMIENSCNAWEVATPVLNTECVMRHLTWYHGLNRWVSLKDASGEHVSHRSLSDCLSTLKVINDVFINLGLKDS